MKILFIDHYDSFSNNIVIFFRAQNFIVDIVLYSEPFLLKKDFPIHDYRLVILSPGPGSPADYPQTIHFYSTIPSMPVFGVCLGHQIMLFASGGKIQKICARPIHGRQIILNTKVNSHMFGQIHLNGSVVLYNSLGCHKDDPVFDIWNVQVVENNFCLMAEHKKKLHLGVQFHPESFASSLGTKFLTLLTRFINKC